MNPTLVATAAGNTGQSGGFMADLSSQSSGRDQAVVAHILREYELGDALWHTPSTWLSPSRKVATAMRHGNPLRSEPEPKAAEPKPQPNPNPEPEHKPGEPKRGDPDSDYTHADHPSSSAESGGTLDSETADSLKANFPQLQPIPDRLLKYLLEKNDQAETEDQAKAAEANRVREGEALQAQVWRFMTQEESSRGAFLVAGFIMVTICISSTAIIVETLPSLAQNNDGAKLFFFVIDSLCVAIFTVEYLVRLWSSPQTQPFLLDPMNMIDVISILPFYITLLSGADISWLTILRTLRMVRLLRYARKKPEVEALIQTLDGSKDIALFMLMMLFIVVIVFASLVYQFERGTFDGDLDCYVLAGDEACSDFVSVPEAMWWCLQTIMFVGYGDIVPTTIPGKLVGGVTCVCGVLVVALPISVLGANFHLRWATCKRNSQRNTPAARRKRSRKLGIQGVLDSRNRVLRAIQQYGSATERCIKTASGALERCTRDHTALWREYLESPGHNNSADSGTEAAQETEESQECWCGNIRTLMGNRQREISNGLPRVGEKELFATLCDDFLAVYSQRLGQCLDQIQEACNVYNLVSPATIYFQLLADAAQVPLESEWEAVLGQVAELEQQCARLNQVLTDVAVKVNQNDRNPLSSIALLATSIPT